MFDLGWTELMVIGIVALIVVGPKDLPGMFRTLGQLTGKARKMAREFQRAMNDAADDAGVADVTKGLKAATNPKAMGLDALKDAANSATGWNPPKASDTLSEERAEAARKIHHASAKKAGDRIAAEKAEAEADVAKPSAKKPAAKKPAATKTAAKKPAAKKPAAKTAVAKKPAAAKKSAAKPAAKKPAARKAPAKGNDA